MCEAGLELVLDELVWMREPQGEVAFLWVLARKPSWRRVDALRVYYGIEFFEDVARHAAFTVMAVYLVQDVGLNPLELVLIGTVGEIGYFLLEVPTGAIADTYSRRTSVILGLFVIGISAIVIGMTHEVRPAVVRLGALGPRQRADERRVRGLGSPTSTESRGSRASFSAARSGRMRAPSSERSSAWQSRRRISAPGSSSAASCGSPPAWRASS